MIMLMMIELITNQRPSIFLNLIYIYSQNDCNENQFADQFTIEYNKKCNCSDNTTVCVKKIINSDSFINTNWSKYTNHLNVSKCLLENYVINLCFKCGNKYVYIFDEYDYGKCQMIGIIIFVFLFLFISLLSIFFIRFIRKLSKKIEQIWHIKELIVIPE